MTTAVADTTRRARNRSARLKRIMRRIEREAARSEYRGSEDVLNEALDHMRQAVELLRSFDRHERKTSRERPGQEFIF